MKSVPTAIRRTSRRPTSAARLDALHLQAGALAHDFNNLMGVILGATEKLANGPDGATAERDLARVALKAAERGAEMLKRLLALADEQAQAQAPAPVDCAVRVEAVMRFAHQIIPTGIAIWAAQPREAMFCLADDVGLDTALLNLCVNAGHAMPQGGFLTLNTRSMALDTTAAEGLGVAPGDYVAIAVVDTGVGMSPQILAQAMEPLFTTRAQAGGAGLGLSAVRDFAAEAGGAFELTSREGEGTTATLYLPQAHGEPSATSRAA